ncbi:response regulator [Aquimarina sediminis]|uniref:response regulator n=1 Tax=Aquimarina sediminis TaxID=2070536 RepID=UPI000CA00CE7|nr:response regulator [Aquimarina sediminis]
MSKKLNMIMLVDDDSNTNLYNEYIINRLDIFKNIKIFQNGKRALEFLITQDDNGKFPQPEIIFLDINMPVMNGWEFLDEYKELTKEQQAQILIAMLTSSMNTEDSQKALSSGVVKEYIHKPLIEERIKEIIDKYFLEH